MQSIKVVFFLLLVFICGYYSLSDISDIPILFVCTIIVLLGSLWNIATLYDGRLSLSSSLIIYTIATQYGLVLPVVLFGEGVLYEYEYWAVEFIHSPYIIKAVWLANLGISSFELARSLCAVLYEFVDKDAGYECDKNLTNSMQKTAMILLLVVVAYFFVFLATGGLKLFGTYSEYMNSPATSNGIYAYILILFYVGTMYLFALPEKYLNYRREWLLWLFIVLIFAANGNRGEFLYALLACIGLRGVLGAKLSKQQILIIFFLLFFILPGIKHLRHAGIMNNLSSIVFNPFSAFVEMGIQLRCTVYVLEEMATNTFHYLYGASYYQPIINFLTPFSTHTTATAEFRGYFGGIGFNQVIESYLNFKEFGVFLYYFFIGFLISYKERRVTNRLQLILWGCITTILINATRNYFAFVIGQTIIVYFIYINVKRTARIK